MGQPGANGSSTCVSMDTHIVFVPTPGGPVPTPLPHPFQGTIQLSTVPSVKIGGQQAAVAGSIAINSPSHIPTPPGTSFQRPPSNQGEVFLGSFTVKIGGKSAARNGDPVKTCNDPADVPVGKVVAVGMVIIG